MKGKMRPEASIREGGQLFREELLPAVVALLALVARLAEQLPLDGGPPECRPGVGWSTVFDVRPSSRRSCSAEGSGGSCGGPEAVTDGAPEA